MVPNNTGLLHHHTLVTRSYTLPNAISVSNKPQKRAAPNQYADCPYNACLYTSPDGVVCRELINCDGVPKHSRKHGIKDLKRKDAVTCRWEGCELVHTRHNHVRHIREHHLGHVRGVGHQIQADSDDTQGTEQTERRGGSEDVNSGIVNK